ncbi:leucine-rich repeat domain-containing protein [Paraflavitalea soli]|uniref:Leucine-rich repeat domain-containing protein n=1 Tax=Paraflavitalea soli TaxID=2315862 RepID=A0A3B7N1V3_9BACT|nr:leucine-rich repeat domain-containing protein [Paraflavitalea soli]AXY76341.1 leucine-rich repeat domain-containing protein [Paraflavitalea soli]
MDLTKYIRYNAEHGLLEWNDYEGAIPSLPDDFFDAYPGARTVSIHSNDLTAMPASFNKLTQLKSLIIYKTKFRELPAGIENMLSLEYIGIRDNNLMDFNKEAVRLSALPVLRSLELNGYRGTGFPEKISLLTRLETLALTNAKKNEQDMPGIFKVIAALPRLQYLQVDFPHTNSIAFLSAANLAILDRLTEVECRGLWISTDSQLPLALGLTKKVKFRYKFEDLLTPFRAFVAGKGYSDLQTQLLFGLFIKNMLGIQELLPNKLAASIAQQLKPSLRLLDKPKGETIKSINSKLEQYGISADNNADNEDTIVVVGGNTTVEEAAPFIVAGRSLITVDHLNEVLIGGGDHWLLTEDNEPVNEQLLQLLCSNQVENYKVAFQIIATGGANKSIQSILAAIMMAHPDKEVHKAAEKLYDKYGSQAFKLYVKESKISLRTGGDVERKVNSIVKHVDVDSMLFRLMFHCIAGANDHIARVNTAIFSISELPDISLPREMIFFTGIKELHFDSCERFDIGGAIALMKQMPECRVLILNGCHITIPASIGELTQLQTLEIAHNTLADENALQSLQQLQVLNVEGIKLKQWDWLASLTQLRTLNINSTGLTAMPSQLYALQQLGKLEAKQNKLTAVPEQLATLPMLNYLDLSNNAIKEFPYFLARLALDTLLLRSNKITEVNTDKLYAANNNKSLQWGELNLARNQLTSFQLREGMHQLRKLDISHNQLEVLDDSLFAGPLGSFYASNNKISVIPRAVLKCGFYTYFWVQHNLITELPDYFAKASIQNCDLSNNKIESIHPDFEKYGKENHGRLYWKLGNNPLPRGQVGGIYI